jgi:glycosyltransferase involved in cell wall biosynthesis
MAEPLVSVLMITYNQAKYIAKAIEGVLQQNTNFPIELVIGEDCSTDGTGEIVLEYKEKHPDIIRVITSNRNVGAAENSIRTRRACRGKYIAFCEGDDYWHHSAKLQKQADYLESHPECGLVYSNYNVHNVKTGTVIGNFITYKNWDVPQNMSPLYFVQDEMSVTILTCTVLLRRDLMERIIAADPYLYDGKHFLMGDVQMWAEMSAAAGAGYIPESLATYSVSKESATRSSDIARELRFQASLSELTLYLSNKYGMPEDIRTRRLEHWCDTSLRLALHERNAPLAEEARKRKKKLTWKDKYRYYGARYSVGYYSYVFFLLLKKMMLGRRKDWYE